MHAVVIGCGIGGATAVLTLAEIGVEVEVYEAAARSADHGGWVTLGPAAMTAPLRRCCRLCRGSPGMADSGTVALSDRPAQPDPPARPEALQQVFECPVCYRSPRRLRGLPPRFGARRGRPSPYCN